MVKKLSEQSPGTQLIAFLVGKVGMKDAIRVGSFLLAWGAAAKSLGHEPTMNEYLVYWKESHATYYRDLKRFRNVWPGEKNPQAKWEWIAENIPAAARADGDQAVLALLLGPVL